MNNKEEIKNIQRQLELLNKEIDTATEKHHDYIQSLLEIVSQRKAELGIAIEKAKEHWIVNPDYLVLSATGLCLSYACEWKKHKEDVWRKGYIVGSSFDSGRLYKIKTSTNGTNYDWACTVRIDPEELEAIIRENTHRMLSEYNIDV